MPPADAAADEESTQITEMISVQMADEDLVQPVPGDVQGGKSLRSAGPDVEDELVAVAQLDQEAGGGLRHARIRHARTAGDDPHLLRTEILTVRQIHIPLPGLDRRDLLG